MGCPAPIRWKRAKGRVPHLALRGSPENSSYKGYGLAVMVNILGSCLSSANLITDPMYTKNLTVMTLAIV
jgi:LDH2 family malate/lactate/ureidoglycolate dehydrogenase